jgi:putative endonuclease
MNASQRGAYGEKLALQYLLNKGYELLATNWRHQHGEIDLIMRDSFYLLFVEVKIRKSNSFGWAYQAVGPEKQRLLIQTAQAYLEQSNYDGEIRFDIISIHYSPNTNVSSIRHIQDAFWADL